LQATQEAAGGLEAEGNAWAADRLTQAEYELWEQLHAPKRRVEWLAGRLAAKIAFARYCQAGGQPGHPGRVSVLNDRQRAPYLAGLPGLWLSISHSHAYAVAILARRRVGVDLEKIEPRHPDLPDQFFSPEEQERVEQESGPAGKKDELVTLYWTRKEAVSKVVQRGGQMVFSRINTVPDMVRVEGSDGPEIELISTRAEGYCLTVALATGEGRGL
jgi:phosphopantetheinyl transferase